MSWFSSQALQLAKQLAYRTGEATAEANLASYYRLKGDYTAALNKLFRSIRIYEQQHAIRSAAYNYLNISQVYKDMSGSARTLEYTNKGIVYSKYAYNLFKTIHDTYIYIV